MKKFKANVHTIAGLTTSSTTSSKTLNSVIICIDTKNGRWFENLGQSLNESLIRDKILWTCWTVEVHDRFVRLLLEKQDTFILKLLTFVSWKLSIASRAVYCYLKCSPRILVIDMNPEILWSKLRDYHEKMSAITEYQSTYLSVLGGAYAAIGKSSKSHAEKAAQIAEQQIMLWTRAKNDEKVCIYSLYLAECLLKLDRKAEAQDLLLHISSEVSKHALTRKIFLSLKTILH
jgi:hypothetical protein